MQNYNKKIYKAVGKVIKNYRLQGKQKFTIFCYENDISKTTLYDIEKGNKQAYLSSVFKIVKALGLSFEEFGALLDKELPSDFMHDKE